jgi:hypothetical protein
MTATALTLPLNAIPSDLSAEPRRFSARRVLLLALLVAGGLLTLFVFYQLGPVAYGLPAPFFRRAIATDPQTV